MTAIRRPWVVIDTNVLFEGLTKQGGVSGYVITANVRHFRAAQRSLGLVVLTPLELITRLASPKGAST